MRDICISNSIAYDPSIWSIIKSWIITPVIAFPRAIIPLVNEIFIWYPIINLTFIIYKIIMENNIIFYIMRMIAANPDFIFKYAIINY